MSENIELIEYLDQHWYKVKIDNDVHYLASVTTKQNIENKPFLAHWRGGIGNREADYRVFEAQMRGTRIHAAWEAMQLGHTVTYDKNSYYKVDDLGDVTICYQDEMMAAYKLQQAFEIIKPKVLHVEKQVYSLKYQYAGTVDSIWQIEAGEYKVAGSKPLKLEGGIYVLDLKSGKSIFNTAYEQVSAYAWALIEMGLYYDIKGTVILHTEAKTRSGIEGFQALLRDESKVPLDFKNFEAVNKLYDMRNVGSGPKIGKFPREIKLEI